MPALTHRASRLVALLAIALLLQLGFWWQSRQRLPDMTIVPGVPGRQAVQALAMGDTQFYFRMLALTIQMSGDTFGRFTPLYKYDFNKLYGWFTLLDTLDRTSNMMPALASYYFSQTQHVEDVRYVVRYLVEHAAGHLREKWWWQAQAAYLASHKLKDKKWALAIARPLTDMPDIPFWARQIPAFIYEQMGEMDEALKIMETIEAHSKSIPPGELNFMRYFVEERLRKLEQQERK